MKKIYVAILLFVVMIILLMVFLRRHVWREDLLDKGEQCSGFTGKIGDCKFPYQCKSEKGYADYSTCK